MNYKDKKIIIATGGTGGHVFPAYSLAKHFLKNKSSVEVITDKRGLKYLEKYTDINLILNNSATIFSGNKFKSIFSLFIIIFSFLKSIYILIKKKPFIVFGMGGYSSFPICLASKVLGIPFIIYENNLFIGKSNKYLLPFAKKIFVSYEGLEGIKSKYKNKIVVIGNIIREEILNATLKENDFNKSILRVLILGGSQAAKSFGEKLPKVFESCISSGIELKIYQQCIPAQNEKLKEFYRSLNIDFELFNFTDDLLKYFSKIDFAITRSGSSMIAELLNCNIPFIAIPYPYAADNHQEKNAIYFKNKGLGFMVKESEINSELFPLIKQIYKDKKLLKQISDKQKTNSDKEIFKKIDIELLDLIND